MGAEKVDAAVAAAKVLDAELVSLLLCHMH